MTALYELTEDLRDAIAQLADLDIDDETYNDTLGSFALPWEDKAVAVAKYIRNQDVLAAAIREQEKALAERRRATENRCERLREYLLRNLRAVECNRIERPEIAIKVYKAAPTLAIDDDRAVPATFWRQPEPPPPTLDRKALLDALKTGEAIPGAHIVTDGARLKID